MLVSEKLSVRFGKVNGFALVFQFPLPSRTVHIESLNLNTITVTVIDICCVILATSINIYTIR